MKRVILILSAVFIFITAYSQTQKGNMYVSGTFSLTNDNSTQDYTTYNYDDKNLFLQFSPGISYFVKDNWAIGTSMTFNINNLHENNNFQSSSNSTNENNYTYYNISINTEYYINVSDKFKIFIRGALGYNYMVEKEEGTNLTPDTQYTHYNNYSIGVHPGVVYFATKHFGITSYLGSMSYNYNTIKDISIPSAYHSNTSSFSLNFGLTSLELGVRYCF